MKQKLEVEIEVPDGYQVGKVGNFTIQYQIVAKELPVRVLTKDEVLQERNFKVFSTRYDKAMIALSALIKLMDKWNELSRPDWKADWNDTLQCKYCITKFDGEGV